MPVAMAVTAGAILVRRVRRRARAAGLVRGDRFASDPRDPVQGFDEVSELQVTPLELDAQSHDDAEAAQDLAGLASEIDEIASGEDVLSAPHASHTRDRPIADHGSGGRRGL
jgi:hypothetical protein